MRVRFIVERGSPMERVMDLEQLPRTGDYISFGDGISRYVGAVVFDCAGMKQDPQGTDWSGPVEVRIDLRLGRPQ